MKDPADLLGIAGVPSFDEIQKRAFDFFWRESHSKTGLTKDRARNTQSGDTYIVASTASTGYALAALPIGVERGWVPKRAAYDRALTTLRFAVHRLPNNHGFFYHFLDWRTGDRVWKCELSSIDSGLFALGALACGRYFKGTEVEQLANILYERMDWRWMQKGGSALFTTEKTLSMGWKPEDGWLKSRWSGYSEASYLYFQALGAPKFDLPADVWTSWGVRPATLEGLPVLGGAGPLFMAQMTPATAPMSCFAAETRIVSRHSRQVCGGSRQAISRTATGRWFRWRGAATVPSFRPLFLPEHCLSPRRRRAPSKIFGVCHSDRSSGDAMASRTH
jgi:hypothetical protein